VFSGRALVSLRPSGFVSTVVSVFRKYGCGVDRGVPSTFYSSPFESRQGIAYAVHGQLHSMPGRTKKYITMAGNDVCENAWYIIHGVSKSAYHNYKAVARGGFCNGSHGNTGMSRPRPHIIQVEANLMTIFSGNADQMPNEFRCIGRSRVNNVLVLPYTLNWDNMRLLSNLVMFLPSTLIY
jgi:hypothetical protein